MEGWWEYWICNCRKKFVRIIIKIEMFCCTEESSSQSKLRGLLSLKGCSCGKENKNKSNNPVTTVSSDSTIGEKKGIKCRSKKNKV